jgi:aminoglycoside phosphotransferase (APT) family kinase protein
VGLADFGRAGNYYQRQLARWAKQYKASETERIEAMERLIAWLPEHIPADDETAVVHGDFRLGNCIVHAVEPRVVAVLDWELSTLGHPLADLGYACMGYHAHTGHTGSFLDVDFAATGIPDEAEFVGHYCRRAGREAIPDWNFHVAFALFRMAAIVQGVYKRGLDGIAASARAIGFKDVCRLRAEQAWALVQGDGR